MLDAYFFLYRKHGITSRSSFVHIVKGLFVPHFIFASSSYDFSWVYVNTHSDSNQSALFSLHYALFVHYENGFLLHCFKFSNVFYSIHIFHINFIVLSTFCLFSGRFFSGIFNCTFLNEKHSISNINRRVCNYQNFAFTNVVNLNHFMWNVHCRQVFHCLLNIYIFRFWIVWHSFFCVYVCVLLWALFVTTSFQMFKQVILMHSAANIFFFLARIKL